VKNPFGLSITDRLKINSFETRGISMNVFMVVNPDTWEIASYTLTGPDDQLYVQEMEEQTAKFPPSFKTYQITDPKIYYKVRDAREFLGEMKPVFDENDDLVDILVTYPDLGEDR
jgi:hypothetical protein